MTEKQLNEVSFPGLQGQVRGTQTDYEFPLGSVTEEQGESASWARRGYLSEDIKRNHCVSNSDKIVLLENNYICIDHSRTFDVFPNLHIPLLKRAGSLAGIAFLPEF